MPEAIPIEWIKDYISHINRIDLEYDPDAYSLDDVVKFEIGRMLDEYEYESNSSN